MGLAILLTGFSTFALAQENLFDTLDDIKSGVEGDTGRFDDEGNPIAVELVDFSEDRPWGNLPAETIQKLEALQINNLKDLAEKAGYLQSQQNAGVLLQYLAARGFAQTDSSSAPILDDRGNPILNDEGNLIVNEIRFKGESQIRSIGLATIKVIRNLIGAIAVIWIVISGIRMIAANGDESKITEQKQSILYALLGLGIILLLERVITLVYGIPGAERGIATTGPGISEEVLGIVSFVKAIIGAVAMSMIIISGFKTIASQGEEEKITNERKSIVWVVVGIIIILVNQIIIENLYIQPVDRQIAGNSDAITTSNIENIINLFGTITQFLLGFVGLIAFAMFIFGGATMIVNYGNDEQVGKARKMMVNAVIGIVVILSAYAIVATVIKFQ